MSQNLPAEGIVRSQAAELRQHLVTANVVGPRCRHGSLEGPGIFFGLAAGGDTLDAAEFGESVDAVGLERFD